MTKEELEKEAEEWLSKNWTPYEFYDTECNVYNDDIKDDLIRAHLAGAEPREKQIQIDAEQIRALQKQNGELTDENERLKGNLELWESGACRATNLDKCGVVKELEAQIEKMKCCGNCRFSESDKLNGTFCHREGCFVVASAKCKLWEN